jgi:hypothetical protein
MIRLFEALEILFTLADIEEKTKEHLPSVTTLRNRYCTSFTLLQANKMIITIRGTRGKTFTEDLSRITLLDVIKALYNFNEYKDKYFYKCLEQLFKDVTIAQLRSMEWQMNGQKMISKS